MLRDPMFRDMMMQHPAVLLRLYQGVSVEEGQMKEEERQMEMIMTSINSGSYCASIGYGALCTGLYWCDWRLILH